MARGGGRGGHGGGNNNQHHRGNVTDTTVAATKLKVEEISLELIAAMMTQQLATNNATMATTRTPSPVSSTTSSTETPHIDTRKNENKNRRKAANELIHTHPFYLSDNIEAWLSGKPDFAGEPGSSVVSRAKAIQSLLARNRSQLVFQQRSRACDAFRVPF